MPTTKAATAYEPRTESVGTSWEKLLTRNGNRAHLAVSNEDTSNGGRYYLPSAESFDDPFCGNFDGGDDFVTVDALISHTKFAACAAGSIEGRVLVTADATVKNIIGFADISVAGTYLKFGFDTDEKLFATAYLAGVEQWTVTADDATPANGWVRVMLVHDAIRPSLYIDGANVSQTRSGDFKTKWFSTLTGLDEVTIGATPISGTEEEFYKGKIDWLQVRDLSEGGKISLAEWHFDDADVTAGTVTDHAATNGVGEDTALTAGALSSATLIEKSDGRIFIANTTTEWDVENAGDSSEISNTVWVKGDATINVTVFETRRG